MQSPRGLVNLELWNVKQAQKENVKGPEREYSRRYLMKGCEDKGINSF